MRIKACIFDLGGTIVDKYSLSTFISLKNAFNTHFINIPNHLIYKDMGKDKKIILLIFYIIMKFSEIGINYMELNH